ncbi:MAG: DinB family protein [Ignavibacterium sp.]|nr:DinB family protein [Ignavibacterium sp.]
MKKSAFLFLICLIFALPISAANLSGDEPIFVKEFIGQMDFVKGRLIQLAEAMPDDKYSWSPGEGVRTVGEVFIHDAEANYYLISQMNGTKPDMNQEKSPSDKKSALAILEKSIEAVKEAASKLTEADLNKEVEAFGMKFSLRNFMITILNHNHEHLGQSIAYARMNGVVPPWSMKGE